MNSLITQLNDFDFFYAFSDDHNVFTKWNQIEKDLKAQITLSPEIENSPELSQKAKDYFVPEEEPKVETDCEDIIF